MAALGATHYQLLLISELGGDGEPVDCIPPRVLSRAITGKGIILVLLIVWLLAAIAALSHVVIWAMVAVLLAVLASSNGLAYL